MYVYSKGLNGDADFVYFLRWFLFQTNLNFRRVLIIDQQIIKKNKRISIQESIAYHSQKFGIQCPILVTIIQVVLVPIKNSVDQSSNPWSGAYKKSQDLQHLLLSSIILSDSCIKDFYLIIVFWMYYCCCGLVCMYSLISSFWYNVNYV